MLISKTTRAIYNLTFLERSGISPSTIIVIISLFLLKVSPSSFKQRYFLLLTNQANNQFRHFNASCTSPHFNSPLSDLSLVSSNFPEMCVNDAEQVAGQEKENGGVVGGGESNVAAAEDDVEKYRAFCGGDLRLRDSFPLESICEDTAVGSDRKSNKGFVPSLRSGEWSDIGGRSYMEDTHVCISDLAVKFGYNLLNGESISFYGVFDGHGGKDAAHFVRDHLPRVIVEDADFPVELEKVVTRSFVETDAAFEKSCAVESTLSSGTTALTAMIFGRSLLVANAGDCRAVLSRLGVAIEMSKDHRPCCINERMRVESMGAFIDDGYLNGQLAVTRALGDWHLEGLKEIGNMGSGPLSAEPELKLLTLTKEDEFLLIGSDGIWDVFTSQNAVDFARRRLQDHNNVKLCCKELVNEAIKRGAIDNLTKVMVCFHAEPPPASPVIVQKTRVRRSISAEGLQNLKFLLEE